MTIKQLVLTKNIPLFHCDVIYYERYYIFPEEIMVKNFTFLTMQILFAAVLTRCTPDFGLHEIELGNRCLACRRSNSLCVIT